LTVFYKVTYRGEAQWATLNEARECAEVIAIKGSCGIASAIESLVNSQAESKLGATSTLAVRQLLEKVPNHTSLTNRNMHVA
jgi:hypothetical protein